MLQSAQKNPSSGIWKKLIPDPDPGIKKAPDPGSGSSTLDARIFQIFMGSELKLILIMRSKILLKQTSFLIAKL
jgi:hypothetical protein